MATDLPKNNSCNSFLPTTLATPVVDMELLQVLCAQASAGSSSPAPGKKKHRWIPSIWNQVWCPKSFLSTFLLTGISVFNFTIFVLDMLKLSKCVVYTGGGHLHLSNHPSWAIKSYCSGMDPWVTGFNICITTILSIWDHWSLFSNNKPDDTWIYESKKAIIWLHSWMLKENMNHPMVPLMMCIFNLSIQTEKPCWRYPNLEATSYQTCVGAGAGCLCK